jgi:hypothetical protein
MVRTESAAHKYHILQMLTWKKIRKIISWMKRSPITQKRKEGVLQGLAMDNDYDNDNDSYTDNDNDSYNDNDEEACRQQRGRLEELMQAGGVEACHQHTLR